MCFYIVLTDTRGYLEVDVWLGVDSEVEEEVHHFLILQNAALGRTHGKLLN